MTNPIDTFYARITEAHALVTADTIASAENAHASGITALSPELWVSTMQSIADLGSELHAAALASQQEVAATLSAPIGGVAGEGPVDDTRTHAEHARALGRFQRSHDALRALSALQATIAEHLNAAAVAVEQPNEEGESAPEPEAESE